MKTKLFFLAAMATFALTSCVNDEFIGDNDATLAAEAAGDGSINFGFKIPNATRADHVGADAATLLNNKFYVVAFNGAPASSMTQTFDNYLVEWEANSAGKTASNTSDWEYVGKTAPAWSIIAGNKQTIKYWDYSKDQYDFIAWSPGTVTNVLTTGDPSGADQVLITKPAMGSPYNPSYALRGDRDALAKCYIADMVTAYKATYTPAQPKYQDEVKLVFRNLACKVRVALYETVPGYSVKDVKFYRAEDDTPATPDDLGTGTYANAHLFTTGTTDDDYFYLAGTYTVDFPNRGSAKISNSDYNKAHVSFAQTDRGTYEDFGALNFAGKESNEVDGDYIGRTLPDASYAGASAPYYKTMLPNEAGTVLELRVDYTLLATDGSGETIKVYGAKAHVPAIYAAWKPNYAYTYVFKISDNTNGWTSQVSTDPEGLYPITFDAVVVDAQEFTQNTITTVASPSITTYQKEHNPAIDGSIIGSNEYDDANGDIYIQVMTGGALQTGLAASNSKLYKLSGSIAKPTEADVMDALNIQANGTTPPETILGRNGLTLTLQTLNNAVTAIPGVDGNNITVTSGTAAMFSPSSLGTGTFAYVYDTGAAATPTYVYSAVHFANGALEPADFSGNYFKDPDGSVVAASFDSTPTEGVTYYRRYTNNNKVYGVKVIKVI